MLVMAELVDGSARSLCRAHWFSSVGVRVPLASIWKGGRVWLRHHPAKMKRVKPPWVQIPLLPRFFSE